jgi:hypothetical protein
MGEKLEKIRGHFLSRWFCITFALHLVNVSVDPEDPLSRMVPEDITINEMESFLEILIEKGLEIEDFFVEYDDPDEELKGKYKTKQIKILTNGYNKDIAEVKEFPYDRSQHIHFRKMNVRSIYLDISIPPPKQMLI